ncbi:MAG: peptidoglycan-binding domain-containing protein [Nostoc sp. DedVER02]|uniref:peptidoglycan-binding domain-containing protein n=1 Tax=unclassified Nostoc TaxID=2593658 RepID=UPI002AD3FB41|nr:MULTISPECIES: peptidoglycan-binding domain-containing protein [unclassified Nostoc]MDZ7986363.1 peptidoglycan-binding domain-containing protein [Nostoc sp. DedVER02]MDZ8112753.1 peptidoglycan-binding domain-containing protein [Nostoc sp. DedVER01b]
MQSSLTASILSYLKLLDPTVNRCRMEKLQKVCCPKRFKSLSAIEILFWATPLLVASTPVVSIAAPQKIAQVNPSDSINRPTLKVGSQGERVSELQAALKLLGFYSGAVDGIYSENTANAVTRFKQAAGLNPDGVVDASTWQRLFPNQPVASTVPSSQPRFNSATNFPVPTQASNVTNVVNPNPNPPRQAVTQVVTKPEPRPTTPKKAVRQTATTSPEPRPATPRKTTTSSRQKTPNRTTSTTRTQATTRTGQNTRTQPKTSTQRTPGIQYTSEGLPILRIGLRGSEVVKLQQQLKKLGFLKGDADGDFGATTETAVKAAQKRYGLEADGVVGGSTWEVLLRR